MSFVTSAQAVTYNRFPEESSQTGRLRRVSQELEAAFLSEMLKHAGLGQAPESFGGGAGEDQFASLLREAQAGAIAANGGIGLAEAIFNALKERENAD